MAHDMEGLLGACRALVQSEPPEMQIKVALGLVIDVLNRNDRSDLLPVLETFSAAIEAAGPRKKALNS